MIITVVLNLGNTDVLTRTAERLRGVSFQPPYTVLGHHRFHPEKRHRFYTALIAYWYAMELHWLLERPHTDTWQELFDLADTARREWSGGPRQDVLAVEMLEMHGFLYKFLLRVVFPEPLITQNWLKNDRTYLDHHSGSFGNYGWSFFVSSCKLFLSPPDIVELLSATCLTRTSAQPFNKIEYLQQRGAFDICKGQSSTRHPEGLSVDWWIEQCDLAGVRDFSERGREGSAPLQQRKNALIKRFPSRWAKEARGSPMLWTWSSAKALDDALWLEDQTSCGFTDSE